MSRAKLIVFDAYGTVLDIHSVLDEASRVFGNTAAASVDLWRAKQLEYSWLRSMMGTYADFDRISRDALAYVLAAQRTTIDDEARQRLLDAWFQPQPFPDVPEALAALGRLGLNRAILSNGSPAMLRLALNHSGLAGSFEHVLSVDDVHRYKPDPAVYRMVRDRLGISADETLFVSSNGFDVAGAKAFGFTTCWVNRGGRALDELGQRPDYEIASMRDLPATLL